MYAIIDKQNVPDDFILEREGALYNSSVNKIKDNIYELNIAESNNMSKGLIKNTDIFTWAVYLKNSKRKLKNMESLMAVYLLIKKLLQSLRAKAIFLF